MDPDKLSLENKIILELSSTVELCALPTYNDFIVLMKSSGLKVTNDCKYPDEFDPAVVAAANLAKNHMILLEAAIALVFDLFDINDKEEMVAYASPLVQLIHELTDDPEKMLSEALCGAPRGMVALYLRNSPKPVVTFPYKIIFTLTRSEKLDQMDLSVEDVISDPVKKIFAIDKMFFKTDLRLFIIALAIIDAIDRTVDELKLEHKIERRTAIAEDILNEIAHRIMSNKAVNLIKS